MLEQAISLMGIGMGTVFSFLVLMVFVMYGTAAILKDRFQDPPAQDGNGKARPSKQDDKIKIAIAIAAAKRMQS
jgi:sodium pump decarboxylase gamma subunit